jgi:hypothetical protein
VQRRRLPSILGRTTLILQGTRRRAPIAVLHRVVLSLCEAAWPLAAHILYDVHHDCHVIEVQVFGGVLDARVAI